MQREDVESGRPTGPGRALARGSQGPAVAALQQALIDAGFAMPISTEKKGSPDGIFGSETERVVRAFQESRTLPATGVADAATQARLQGRPAKPAQEQGPAEGSAKALTNPRFTGNSALAAILAGSTVLSATHDGPGGAVAIVQEALVDLSFELPMHGADGEYGPETEAAIRQFRSVNKLPAGSQLDRAALAALDVAAPKPGQGPVEKTADYDRLTADGKIDITVGIGATDVTARRKVGEKYEESGKQVEEVTAAAFRAWLGARGFTKTGAEGAAEFWSAKKQLSWVSRDGKEQSKEVAVRLRLVTPQAGAAEAFRTGLTEDEIAIYKGHARYGSGPDFDAKASPAENFRVGIDAALKAAGRQTAAAKARKAGVALDREHDLKKMTASEGFDREKYRLWFIQACTSLAYLDEFRSEVAGPEHLDVVASKQPTSFSADEAKADLNEIKAFLDGFFQADSIQAIVTRLDAVQHKLGKTGSVFSSSGFGDNPNKGGNKGK